MGGKVYKEATGVYEGVLQEDMVDTVKRLKKPYLDILIEEFHEAGDDYPLTLCPVGFMVLPLKKGDKVNVKYSQDNLLYPYLWSDSSEIEDPILEDFKLEPSGLVVQIPATSPTLAIKKLGENSYIINTEVYTVIRYDNQAFLMDKEGILKIAKVYQVKSNKVLFECGTSAFKISAEGIELATGGASGWIPNSLPNCLFSGVPHGGVTGGVLKLKGG